MIKNKENDIEIKKFIFKIKSFAKNTNIEENEKLSSVDDTFAGKSLDDSSESFDNTFLCKNSTADSNDKIHSDKASEEAYENICSNGGVSEGCENKYSYNNENSCGDGVHETYEEIYSYSDRNNAYFDDRDFDRDIKLIIEGLELNPEIDVSLEEDVDERYYLKNGQVMDKPIEQEYSFCLDSNYWKGSTLNSFLEKHRRQLVTDKINEDGKYVPRRLTPRETWRLMGVNEEDIDKASQLISQTSLYKQSGNSIVVPVLEAIFRQWFINIPNNKVGLDRWFNNE